MKFRSNRRGMAAFTSTALAAGALAAVPALMMASPAHAASVTAEDVAFSCVFGQYTVPYTTDIAFEAEWTAAGRAQISADFLDGWAHGAPVFANSPSQTQTSVLAIQEVSGTPKSGTLNGTQVGPFTSGVNHEPPTATGTPVAASSETFKLSITGLTMTLGATNVPCTLATPVAVPDLAIDMPAAAPGEAQFVCSTFGTTFAYLTTPEATATRVAGTTATTVTVDLDDMPGIVPAPLTDVTVAGSMPVQAGGVAATATGSHFAAAIAPNAPIPVPTMTTTVASSAANLSVVLGDATFNAEAGMVVPIPCTLASPFEVGATVTETQSPVPPAKATKTTVKVKANSKKRTAVITVAVTNKAAGKVKITVKGAGTKVTKTVTVKSGKATLKLTKKQLKKKGKRTVTAAFAANAKFKASTGKTTFKIK
ncbi:hypothetical protein NODU109028_07580 [Nocardioides dubius]|uniref:Ig-like domain (Group 3) n=1 Tax=Nocardioides dubius TaxID=317019 RepID=A0ABN1U0A5_9ACTN